MHEETMNTERRAPTACNVESLGSILERWWVERQVDPASDRYETEQAADCSLEAVLA